MEQLHCTILQLPFPTVSGQDRRQEAKELASLAVTEKTSAGSVQSWTSVWWSAQSSNSFPECYQSVAFFTAPSFHVSTFKWKSWGLRPEPSVCMAVLAEL